jgi:hypothetical protein
MSEIGGPPLLPKTKAIGPLSRPTKSLAKETSWAGITARLRECVLFIGTQFSNLYTAVDTPANGPALVLGNKGRSPLI